MFESIKLSYLFTQKHKKSFSLRCWSFDVNTHLTGHLNQDFDTRQKFRQKSKGTTRRNHLVNHLYATIVVVGPHVLDHLVQTSGYIGCQLKWIKRIKLIN